MFREYEKKQKSEPESRILVHGGNTTENQHFNKLISDLFNLPPTDQAPAWPPPKRSATLSRSQGAETTGQVQRGPHSTPG
jgi:hypothetical protein